MFKLIVVCGLLFAAFIPLEKKNQTKNYRPYIAVNLAKAILEDQAIPTPKPKPEPVPDDDEELCDGSGWITHGDGHKTKCPGCKACAGDAPEKVSVKKNETQDADSSEDGNKFIVYHMGASWCGPCKTMIKNVWKNEDVLKKISESNAKLELLDSTKSEDKKYFKKFNVKSYPTLVIVSTDNPSKAISKTTGNKSKKYVLNLLEDKLND